MLMPELPFSVVFTHARMPEPPSTLISTNTVLICIMCLEKL